MIPIRTAIHSHHRGWGENVLRILIQVRYARGQPGLFSTFLGTLYIMYNCTFRIFIMFDLKNLCRRIIQVDILPKEEFETFNKWMMTSTTGAMPNVSMEPTQMNTTCVDDEYPDDEYSDDGELKKLVEKANKNSSGNTQETRHVNRPSSAWAQLNNTRSHGRLQRPRSEGADATRNGPAGIPPSVEDLIKKIRSKSHVHKPIANRLKQNAKRPRARRFGSPIIGKKSSLTRDELIHRMQLMKLREKNRATLDGKTEG